MLLRVDLCYLVIFFTAMDRITQMGTDDVITCHVVALYDPFTKVGAFAHFDEYVRIERLQQLVNEFLTRVKQGLYHS